MAGTAFTRKPTLDVLEKSPTGIQGLDEITGGGLPKGRSILVCGPAGCGKTLLGAEFLVRGATQYGEPGVFLAFEETTEELTKNVAALGFDLNDLVARNLLAIDYVQVERSEIEETGEYDLEGLFVRLGYAIDTVGAKRVVMDTLEALFAGLPNEAVLRAELRRLFRWLKARGVTAIITGERGDDGKLTRYGIEEYISDCVILLDHRITAELSTRRLRIVKYRGSAHGTNEYPFLLSDQGLSILPITSLEVNQATTNGRISTGIPQLDVMLSGQGYYRGSIVLVSGTAGAGKSSIATHFVDAACRRGERCLFFSLEESVDQLVRNMRSIGIDLQSWLDQGLLRIHASRPMLYGLEMHLLVLHKLVQEFQPAVVIIDPITDFLGVGNILEVKIMLMRLIDFLKLNQITALLTSLITGSDPLEQVQVNVSSLMDVWLVLRNLENRGERNRELYIIKSRGMGHSSQIREFLLTDHGFELVDVSVGPDGVLLGSARRAQAAALERASAAGQTAAPGAPTPGAKDVRPG